MTIAKGKFIPALFARAVVLWLLIAGILALAVACGGGDNGGGVPATEETAAEEPRFSGVVVTQDLATGTNRFGIGVIDEKEGRPLLGAQVSLRFFKVLSDNQAQLRFEGDTEFVGFETYYIDQETGDKVATGNTGFLCKERRVRRDRRLGTRD